MIKLPKATKSDWIEFEDGQRILVDYPKGKQVHHLQDLMIASNDKDGEINMSVFMDYARYLIKYTIKDWEGFPEECKLRNNELDNDLWYALTEDISQTQMLFAKIAEVVAWGDTEKKN